MDKFAANIARDRSARRELKRMNWAALVVWACELRDPESLAKRLDAFLRNC
jgi:G:T-mismatch repair DNA endonuclease (very short patch repair protein)